MSPTTPDIGVARLLELVESGPAPILLMDGTGTISWANRTAAATLGMTVDELVGSPGLQLLHPDDVAMAANAIGIIASGRLVGDDPYRLVPNRYRLRTGPDDYGWFEIVLTPMHAPDEAPMVALALFDATRITNLSEIVSRVAAHDPIERILADLVRINTIDMPLRAVAVTWTDDDGTRRTEAGVIPTALLTGEDATLPWNRVRTADGPVTVATADMPEALRDRAEASGFRACTAFCVSDRGAPEQAVVTGWWPSPDVAEIQVRRLQRDMVPLLELALDRRRHLRRLSDAASRDALTGLANRRTLLAHLTELATDARGVGLMYCDLDGFKPVNDAYGHAVGDRVLVAIAERLASVTRDADLAARIGGDEFAVVLTGADEPVAAALAERVLAAVAEPIDLGDGLGTVTLGVSVGVAVAADGDAFDADALLHCADEAMYAAKRDGAGRSVVVQLCTDGD